MKKIVVATGDPRAKFRRNLVIDTDQLTNGIDEPFVTLSINGNWFYWGPGEPRLHRTLWEVCYKDPRYKIIVEIN